LDILFTILSIVGAIIIFGIIIMIHEFGHYSVGRLCKIKIVEFAIGFGPKIKSWVKNGIKYSVRWIWVGGFTKFLGEDDELEDPNAFNKQPAWRRALTIAAGPVFNLLLAFILAIIILCAFGEYVPTVGEVWEDSPAQEAGLQNGDIVTSLNGVQMDFYMELESAQRQANEDYVALTVLRDGEEFSFEIQKEYYERMPEANRAGRTDEQMVVNRDMAGLSFGVQRVTYGFFEAIGKTFKWIYVLLAETLIAFAAMVAAIFGVGDKAILNNAIGVVRIVEMLGEAIRSSFETVLRLGVLISVSLAIFNLIPFPALDGGRLVFIGIEKATGKPVPRKIEGIIHFVGIILLFGLMILIVYRDIASMIGG